MRGSETVDFHSIEAQMLPTMDAMCWNRGIARGVTEDALKSVRNTCQSLSFVRIVHSCPGTVLSNKSYVPYRYSYEYSSGQDMLEMMLTYSRTG